MKEQNIAKVYAQAFLALAKEFKFDAAAELTKFTEVINTSNNLENVLFLDVFTNEEKKLIIDDIAKKLKLNTGLLNGLHFLVDEKRLALLPVIFKEIVVLDDHEKGFLRGTIQGFEAQIPAAVKTKLENYIETKIGRKPVLDYVKNDEVTAGYRITVEDMQLDASIDNQLNQFKESLL
ncbi:MAG: F0F1 ATP synthase subunit delta [Bacteriovoracaceae bacterium]|nr:F0F1 ATP synthase subunit delta [Bacteriovoracaceae bacterium]